MIFKININIYILYVYINNIQYKYKIYNEYIL